MVMSKPTELFLSSSLRSIEAEFAEQPLMQRAGLAAADLAGELATDRNRPILILAGPGNNGGDAFEAARLLRERFFLVAVVFAGDPARLPKDAAAAYRHFAEAGGTTIDHIPDDQHWGLIVDGLFGIGLTRAPEGRYAEWIGAANRLAERDACPLLALDCPSGLNADSGTAFTPCIRASHTVTFISAKPGLYTADGSDHCGQISIADLGIVTAQAADGAIVTTQAFRSYLKPRARNSHKGSFGNAGILGGNRSMLGAALLAGRAALRLGAGRVYLGLLDPTAPPVDPLQAELMLRSADALLQTELDALACGPGLGTSDEARRVVEQSLKSAAPIVLDADALNILAGSPELQSQAGKRNAATLLTPHPAEAARLLGVSLGDVQCDRIGSAKELARRYRSHVALKGCGTVVASVSGRWWINTSGNPGMASAGMGDVLTGLIAALLAQGWPAEEALLAGVHLHGAAADRLVAQGIGPVGLTAGEVVNAARQLFNEWLGMGGFVAAR